eukprot:3255411-Lingulodinium_polyedra.AAC.1
MQWPRRARAARARCSCHENARYRDVSDVFMPWHVSAMISPCELRVDATLTQRERRVMSIRWP